VNIKSQSEIIGSILMLAITIALSLIIFGIAYHQFNIESVTFAQNAQAANSLVNENFIIAHIYYNPSLHIMIIYIYNTGSVPLNITQVIINNMTKCSSSNICSASYSYNIFVNPSTIANITITSINLSLNTLYNITVVSQVYLGNQPTAYYKQVSITYSYSSSNFVY